MDSIKGVYFILKNNGTYQVIFGKRNLKYRWCYKTQIRDWDLL